MAHRKLTAALMLLASLALGAPARAQTVSETRLRALETQALGAEHAAEHALQRAAARRAGRRSARPVARAAATGDPASVGRWDPPFPAKTFGIHASLLPTGKVAFWGYPVAENGARPNYGQAWLYDPAKGTGDAAWKEIKPPLVNGVPAPIYCSGQSLLADGRLLVAGGNLRFANGANGWLGEKFVFTFDPWTESWVRQSDMARGRWYPSQVLLPDGATVLLGGYTEEEPGNVDTSDLEVFHPDGSVELKTSGARETALYPHLFTMPSGDVLMAGPAAGDNAVLDTDTWTWRDTARTATNRVGSTAVLRPAGPSGSTKVTQIGGYDYRSATQDHPSLASTETLDYTGSRPAWQPDASLNVGRSYHNTVLLPDGSMVTLGGSAGRTVAEGTYAAYGDGRARQVELWDPATGQWRLGPAQAEERGYHSTAVLLPDGRVLSTGDDKHPVASSDTVEIYSPPYLFRGDRPTIAFAPAASRWSDTFGIATAANVAKAVLMAPGQTTHGADMHQRAVELEITERLAGRGVNIATPGSAAVAPPGYYLLFVVDDRGVPSVGRWIRLGGDAPDVPILVPQAPPADPTPTLPPPPALPPGDEVPVEPGPGWSDDTDDGRADDTTAPDVTVQLGRIGFKPLVRGRKLKVTIAASERGEAEIRIVPRWLTFDRTVNFRKAGKQTFAFRPRLSARRRLRRMHGVELAAKVWFRDRARNVRYTSDRHNARPARRR